MYFDKSRSYPVRYYINCDFPTSFSGISFNQNYNGGGGFNQFLSLPLTPVDTLLSYNRQMTFLKPLLTSKQADFSGYDYVVFVYWSRFMGRQSKRLIETVQRNAALAKGDKVKLIYVNNDGLYDGI